MSRGRLGETTADVVPDDEVVAVHGNARFGMPPRRVVDEGVLKYAVGFEGGSTMLAILIEHGLIRRPRPGSSKSTLTPKGRRYLRALLSPLNTVLDAVGSPARPDPFRAFVEKVAAAECWDEAEGGMDSGGSVNREWQEGREDEAQDWILEARKLVGSPR